MAQVGMVRRPLPDRDEYINMAVLVGAVVGEQLEEQVITIIHIFQQGDI